MKKFFKNNKGFTLVELIIVIAVMAILTVVVAPQYLQYVEKSRIGTDENAVGELAHICEISYVEVAATAGNTGDNIVEITIDSTGKFTYDAPTGELDKLVAKVYPGAVAAAAGVDASDGAYVFKSKAYTKDGAGDIKVKFEVNKTTGICKVTDNIA